MLLSRVNHRTVRGPARAFATAAERPQRWLRQLSPALAQELAKGTCYDPYMQDNGKTSGAGRGKPPRMRNSVFKALIEMAFVVFLFYSNLLMGEFTVANGRGKSLATALIDIFTGANLLIAISAATIGYLVFEFMRKKL
jgi:hypothetical protein